MSNSRFDIILAVVNALRFAAAEWRYLLATGLFPLAATFITNTLAFFWLEKQAQTGLLATLMLTLPASAVMAWFMFLQARLIVFGERLGFLPQEAAARAARFDALRASVTVWLLFKMGVLAFTAYMVFWFNNSRPDSLDKYSFFGLLFVGAAFWGLRLGVAHILAAVGYSIRKYIFRVNGAMISLRLIGMGLIVALPFEMVTEPLRARLISAEAPPDTAAGVALLFFISLSNVAAVVVLNAAAVFALKDMLGREDRKERTSKA